MFEELCRKHGILQIPTGTYQDSVPVYREYPVDYFAMDKNQLDNSGRLQSLTQYYCKGYNAAAPAGCKLICEDGTVIDSMTVEYLYNHFENSPEFNVITAVHT